MLLYNSRLRLFPGKLKSKLPGSFKVSEMLENGVIEVENLRGRSLE